MKFIITRTSDSDFMEIRDFSTLEDLMKFYKNCNCDLIIRGNFFNNFDADYIKKYYPTINAQELVAIEHTVEIYDDYRE